MYAKSLAFLVAMVLFLPVASYAESWTASNSAASIDGSAFSNGSVVILSEEATSMPGYFHTRYALVDQNCGAQITDYYGPRIDPSDKNLQRFEQRVCTELAMNTRDGE
jgi:hypothetical protein